MWGGRLDLLTIHGALLGPYTLALIRRRKVSPVTRRFNSFRSHFHPEHRKRGRSRYDAEQGGSLNGPLAQWESAGFTSQASKVRILQGPLRSPSVVGNAPACQVGVTSSSLVGCLRGGKTSGSLLGSYPCSAGSSPVLPTRLPAAKSARRLRRSSSVVERSPEKPRVAGSSPAFFIRWCGATVAHRLGKSAVVGSSPVASFTVLKHCWRCTCLVSMRAEFESLRDLQP